MYITLTKGTSFVLLVSFIWKCACYVGFLDITLKTYQRYRSPKDQISLFGVTYLKGKLY